jgi:hypothetical protein
VGADSVRRRKSSCHVEGSPCLVQLSNLGELLLIAEFVEQGLKCADLIRILALGYIILHLLYD